MAELLTHVLVGVMIGLLLSLRYGWVKAPQVTLVMIGAASPDLSRIGLIIDPVWVQASIGVAIDWSALHYLGGNLIVLAIAALMITREWRTRAFVLLVIGATSHHALDLLMLTASGYVYPVWWPLTAYHPPAGMLYRSSDRFPAVLAIVCASVVWYFHARATNTANRLPRN